MGYRNVRLIVVLGVLLAIGGFTPLLWRHTAAFGGHVYTVTQVSAALAAHPKAWIGRTILVQGTAFYCSPGGGGDCAYEYVLTSTKGFLPLGVNPPNPIIQALRDLPLIGAYIVGPAYWTGAGIYRVRLRHAPGCRFGACLEGLVLARAGT